MKEAALPTVPVTWFTFYDCQSLIQLAAGINLALVVGATLRTPHLAAFNTAADRAMERIAWWKDIVAKPQTPPIAADKIQIAKAFAESGDNAVRQCRDRIEEQAKEWQSSDNRMFKLAVVFSLACILLLFIASGPHKTVEVDTAHLDRIIRAKHMSYRWTMFVCALLYVPLALSLIGFVRSRWSIRRSEAELNEAVAEVRQAVHNAVGATP